MRNTLSNFNYKLVILFIPILMFSCVAQEEEEELPILNNVTISDCNFERIPNSKIIKSHLQFLASAQIFNQENKQGLLSVYFEVEYDGKNFTLNFHTESNIFDNYLNFENTHIDKHEVLFEFYFEGSSDPFKIKGGNVDLIESNRHIRNDSFIGYTFNLVNIDQEIVDKLSTTKLVKFGIHDDMIGIYSYYRKDILKKIKCLESVY